MDFARYNTSSFVYSVPIDAGSSDGVLVTASRAIVLGSGKQRAPAAVVGLQFQHKLFADRFFNHTEKCGSKDCRIKCRSETTECLLVDNNAFILVSEDDSLTGRHLSSYDFQLLISMTEAKVFLAKRVLDHQAMCIESYTVSGPANFLVTPFDLLRRLLVFVWTKVTLIAVEVYLNGLFDSVRMLASGQEVVSQDPFDPDTSPSTTPKDGIVIKYEGEIPIIKSTTKTKPRPCVREHELYDVNPRFMDKDMTANGTYRKCPSFTSSCEP